VTGESAKIKDLTSFCASVFARRGALKAASPILPSFKFSQ
jgi:hypothetical protein